MLTKDDLGTVAFDELFATRLLARTMLARLPKADIEALIQETEDDLKTIDLDELSEQQRVNLDKRSSALLNLLREALALAR